MRLPPRLVRSAKLYGAWASRRDTHFLSKVGRSSNRLKIHTGMDLGNSSRKKHGRKWNYLQLLLASSSPLRR